jgi:hypothetical protein
LAEPGRRLRDIRSGSTGGAVNVGSVTLERQLSGESPDRSGSLSAVASNWEGNGGFTTWRTTMDQPECTDRRHREPWNKGDEFSGYNSAQASTPEAFPRRVDSSLLRYLRKAAKH